MLFGSQYYKQLFEEMQKNLNKLKDFQICEKIGQGSFSQVYKVKRIEDGQFYAMKKVLITSMQETDRKNALNEVRVLASEKSDYVIGYKQAFCDDKGNVLYLVMEYAQGGDIAKSLRRLVEQDCFYEQQEIWKALTHISLGLVSLHSKHIMHRDLKPANIFITADGIYKLGDLNVSKVLKNDIAKTQIGTPLYIPPQIWRNKSYSYKSDIWSLGCIIYEMAARKTPFVANDVQGLFRKVSLGVFPRIPTKYSESLWALIKSMLQQKYEERPTALQILDRPETKLYYNKIQTQKINLIKTIKIKSSNIKSLKDILPSSQYQSKSISDREIQCQSRPEVSYQSPKRSLKIVNRQLKQRKSVPYTKDQVFVSPIKIEKLVSDNISNPKNTERSPSEANIKPNISFKRIVKIPLREMFKIKDKKDNSHDKVSLKGVVSCKNIVFDDSNSLQKNMVKKQNPIIIKNQLKIMLKVQRKETQNTNRIYL